MKLTQKQLKAIRTNVDGAQDLTDEQIQNLVDEQDAIDASAIAPIGWKA